MSVIRKRSPRGAELRRPSGRSAAWAVRGLVVGAGAALVAWGLLADAHWAERHVLTSYCATHPVEWVMARALRWIAGALGVLAATKLAAVLARRAQRASLRVRAGALVGIAVAVTGSLAMTELHMRRLYARLAFGGSSSPSGGREVPMARPDPRLGWSYFPERTTWVQIGGRKLAYAIDAEGDRAASMDDRSDPDRPTVVFTGESIAFGYGLPYEETIPFLVGRDLGVQAINLAVVGYGNDQAYLRLLDALPRYRHPVAIVTVFVPDQIRRNVDDWRPRLALGPDGALAIVPPSTGPRIAKLLQVLPFHGDDALRVTAAVLRATAEVARTRGAFPLFVVTNYGPACLREGGDESWVVEELFVRQGLPFVRVDLGPEDRLPGLYERHPSLRGTRAIAAAVAGALSQHLAATCRAADRPGSSAPGPWPSPARCP